MPFDIVAGHWSELGDDFYPDDLPAAWRLTYFANAFPAVFVDANHWSGVAEVDLKRWRDEVWAGFLFYLGWPAGGAPGSDCLGRARAALGPALGGLVADRGATGVPRDLALFHWVGVPRSACSPVPAVPGVGVALRFPSALAGDLRGARAWLERVRVCHGDAATLVVPEVPWSETGLRRLRDLAALMGG